MSIKLTNAQEVQGAIEDKLNKAVNGLVKALAYCGEELVNIARQSGKYNNQSGNLRSSIGFLVVVDGQVKTVGGFKPAERGTDKATGQKEGKAYAQQLAQQYPKGITLVVVAGMDYALYVDMRGLNVLDTAELKAKEVISTMLQKLDINNVNVTTY